MKRSHYAGALILIAASPYAHAYDSQYAFVQMGRLQLSNDTSIFNTEGTTVRGEYDDLPYFSAGVQRILGGERFRYGFEGGGIISWQNDSVYYSGTANGGAQVAVQIDNEMFLFGTFLGGYLDVNFSDNVRLFVSAGPMLLTASLSQKGDEPSAQPHSTVIVNGKKRDFSSGYGGYASFGVVVSPTKTYEFGFVLREQDVELNFSDAITDFPYDGTQVMLSIGYKI
jgi:hypothetical protein